MKTVRQSRPGFVVGCLGGILRSERDGGSTSRHGQRRKPVRSADRPTMDPFTLPQAPTACQTPGAWCNMAVGGGSNKPSQVQVCSRQWSYCSVPPRRRIVPSCPSSARCPVPFQLVPLIPLSSRLVPFRPVSSVSSATIPLYFIMCPVISHVSRSQCPRIGFGPGWGVEK